MKNLFWNELEGMSLDEVKEWICREFQIEKSVLENKEILAGYSSIFGYSESAWFLVKDNLTGDLFEVNAGHCSCYGYEDQWEPKPTTLKYLLSDMCPQSRENKNLETWLKQLMQ